MGPSRLWVISKSPMIASGILHVFGIIDAHASCVVFWVPEMKGLDSIALWTPYLGIYYLVFYPDALYAPMTRDL